MWGVTRRFCTHRANTDLTGLVVCVATTSTGFVSFALFAKAEWSLSGSEDPSMCLRPLPDRATTTAPCQALTKICAFALLMLESDPSPEMPCQIVRAEPSQQSRIILRLGLQSLFSEAGDVSST
jgi:hypothetical protein